MADIKKINGMYVKDEAARNSIEELANSKVDKEEGKSLVLDTEIERLATLLKSYNQEYRGYNYLLADSNFTLSDAGIVNDANMLAEINANCVLVVFYIVIYNNWEFVTTLDLNKYEYALTEIYNRGVQPKALKIHFQFRGDFTGVKTEPTEEFFENYKNFIASYLEIGKKYGMDTVFVSNEAQYLTALTVPDMTMQLYKNLIADIKLLECNVGIVFAAGECTACNEDLFDYIDIIGINNYPAISSIGTDIKTSLAVNFFDENSYIYRFAKQFPYKEVWMTEVGCTDYPQSLATPEKWNWTTDSNVTDDDLVEQNGDIQSFYYKIALESLKNNTSINGIFFWASSTGWAPKEKTKEVIKKYWSE